MRHSIGDRIRAAVRIAVRDLGSSATAARIEQRIRERDPPLYAEWRSACPEAGARLAFLGPAIASERPRRTTAPRAASEPSLWPVGSRQRWYLLAHRGAVVGSKPDANESGFFLHNFGSSDVLEVTVSIAGLWQEYVPRIRAGETTEIEWSEERIHPSDAELPPAEARGYPDPYRPSGDRQENRCELRLEFVEAGRRRLLEGLLYFWAGATPTFFQQTGSPEALDRARPIR